MFNFKNNKLLILIIGIIIVYLIYLLLSNRNSNKFEKIITLKKYIYMIL